MSWSQHNEQALSHIPSLHSQCLFARWKESWVRVETGYRLLLRCKAKTKCTGFHMGAGKEGEGGGGGGGQH